jgi:hypothetical protein
MPGWNRDREGGLCAARSSAHNVFDALHDPGDRQIRIKPDQQISGQRVGARAMDLDSIGKESLERALEFAVVIKTLNA